MPFLPPNQQRQSTEGVGSSAQHNNTNLSDRGQFAGNPADLVGNQAAAVWTERRCVRLDDDADFRPVGTHEQSIELPLRDLLRPDVGQTQQNPHQPSE